MEKPYTAPTARHLIIVVVTSMVTHCFAKLATSPKLKLIPQVLSGLDPLINCKRQNLDSLLDIKFLYILRFH